MRRQRQPDQFFINGFARGPEIIPRPGTRAREDYDAGHRFYSAVLPGQRFPEGAGPKELARLAEERAAELLAGAAQTAIVHTPPAEAAETPTPAVSMQPQEAGLPPAGEALAA